MLIDRVCERCAAPFTLPKSRTNRFCSTSCMQASRDEKLSAKLSAPKVTLSCKQCGADFETTDTPYGRRRTLCSRACVDASNRGKVAHNRGELVEVSCGICTATSLVWPARAKMFRYCSRACLAESKRRVRGVDHKLFKGPAARVCEWCGARFECKPAKVAMGEGRFCSRQCAGSSSSFAQMGRRSSIEVATEAWMTMRGIHAAPQVQIGPWLVDFYIEELHLVVECDGDYWHSLPRSMARDRQKNWWMEANGYRIIRLTEAAIRAEDFSSLEAALTASTAHRSLQA